MVLVKKEGAFLGNGKIKYFGLVVLFKSLAISAVTTIWALYINSFVNNPSITGIISGALTAVSFVSYFLFIPLIEKSDKGKLFSRTLIFTCLLYILFFFNNNFYLFLLLAIALTSAFAVRVAVSGVLIKDGSNKRNLVSNEGLLYTFLNLGWVIGPLLTAYLLSKVSINFIFLIAAIFTLIAIVVFSYSGIRDRQITKKTHSSLFGNFREFFKDKRRIMSYVFGGGASTFTVLIYLFIPLYLSNSGFSKSFIAYFLFFVAIPLMLFEYPFSKMASTLGYKKMFSLGFLISGMLILLAFFITNTYILLFLLILSSIGYALLEPTAEAYFLSVVNKKQTSRFFGPYNTTRDTGQFIAKIVPSLMLLFLPFKSVLLFFGGVLLLMFFIALKIKEDEK